MIPDEPVVTTGPDDESPAHTDLDHLAGIWSTEEAQAFEHRTKPFGVVEEKLWR